MKKKSLALFLALTLVVVAAISGTVAWLTAGTDAVTNTFTTSDINITLNETTGEEYKMVPGYTISKDPTVKVLEGSAECYLFVKVEKSENFSAFLTFEMEAGWTALDRVPDVYYRVVKADDIGTSYGVLKNDEVSVKDTVTKTMMDKLTVETYPSLNVTAYASQYSKDGTANFTAAEAWDNVPKT